MNQETRKKVFSIIQSVINIDPSKVDLDKDLREQVNLDSMQFVAVMAKLENDLCIELPISAMEAQTLGEFLAVVDGELSKSVAVSE